jgi:hypothetical protein
MVISALRRAIAEVKQRWSVIGWVTKNSLELLRASERSLSRWSRLHSLLAPTNLHWARVVGYGPFSLCVIHMEGLYLSSGDINRLMMKQLTFKFRTKIADVTSISYPINKRGNKNLATHPMTFDTLLNFYDRRTAPCIA